MAKTVANKKVAKELKVEDLSLDDLNYRLPETTKGSSQNELIELLAQDYSLAEIGQSLADNGYFQEEPLIALEPPKGKFIVVEGNRRLAALKLLLSSDLAKSLQLREWVELKRECKYDLHEVPVIVYQDRQDIVPYLGFRHITGVKRWEPFAKARFINFLVFERKKTFQEIAREIGSKAQTMKMNYIGYRLIVQARNSGIDTEGAERDFGVLYRALNSKGVKAFISLELDKSEAALKNPIPKSSLDELGEAFMWMFGTKKDPAILKDSRRITDFGVVLESPAGLKALRAASDLDYAYEMSGGEKLRLLNHLQKAGVHLDQALRDAHRHSKGKEIISAVKRCWDSLQEIVRHYPSVKKNEHD